MNNDYCDYCGKCLRGFEESPCPTCQALRQLIAANSQLARNIFDQQLLKVYLRTSPTAFIKLLCEVEDDST